MLEAGFDLDGNCAVEFWMPHHHIAGQEAPEHRRVVLACPFRNDEGELRMERVLCDMSIEDFEALPHVIKDGNGGYILVG